MMIKQILQRQDRFETTDKKEVFIFYHTRHLHIHTFPLVLFRGLVFTEKNNIHSHPCIIVSSVRNKFKKQKQKPNNNNHQSIGISI